VPVHAPVHAETSTTGHHRYPA